MRETNVCTLLRTGPPPTIVCKKRARQFCTLSRGGGRFCGALTRKLPNFFNTNIEEKCMGGEMSGLVKCLDGVKNVGVV